MKLFRRALQIYIIPTKMGGYFNGLIFLMFLLSVGYSNNLLLIFTLFLFSFNLLWVIQTHFHLKALKIQAITIQDGHATEKVQVSLHLEIAPPGPHQWKIKVEGLDLFLVENSEHEILGQVIFPKRGVWDIKSLRIKTEKPFGLYQAWAYYPVEIKAYAYPSRLPHETLAHFFNSSHEGENSTLKPGPHDIWNLSPYQGEESRKINWKHYARSGELVIKEGEEFTEALVQFRFDGSELNKEYLLSKMATEMVLCTRSNIPFSFETQHLKFKAGLGEKHLRDCLRELTLC